VSREDSPPGIINFADFGKVQLRTARVLKAAPVEGADRLLLLQVDLGTEQRQIVAGVAEYYRPEDLTGRNIVVVANLKPARIRGQLSQGMLLAAKKGDQLAVVMVPDEFPPGAEVS
jgi:methionyl-tRNA synthetase